MQKVMIIDDSLVVRKIVETAMRRAGVSCASYKDGIEAIQALKEQQAQQDALPDLIFLDIGLPRLDGYDVLRLLKTSPRFDRTPIFILSAHDGVLDRVKSRLAGARGHINKPFKVQELLSVVRAS
jgi:twitching motility two-component system response regulator PilG